MIQFPVKFSMHQKTKKVVGFVGSVNFRQILEPPYQHPTVPTTLFTTFKFPTSFFQIRQFRQFRQDTGTTHPTVPTKNLENDFCFSYRYTNFERNIV